MLKTMINYIQTEVKLWLVADCTSRLGSPKHSHYRRSHLQSCWFRVCSWCHKQHGTCLRTEEWRPSAYKVDGARVSLRQCIYEQIRCVEFRCTHVGSCYLRKHSLPGIVGCWRHEKGKHLVAKAWEIVISA